MRKVLGLLATAGLLAAPAFTQINGVNQHDGSTDFTSRGIGGATEGWALNRWSIDHQGGGIGASGITGWRTTMQDQNCAGLENFQFALVDAVVTNPGFQYGDINGNPDPNGVIAATAVFLSPTGGPTTPCAWIYTTTFTTPLAGCLVNDIYTATYLPSNALWTADGISSHISIVGQGASQEVPLLAMANPAEPQQEYGVNMSGGTGPSMTTPQLYPGSPRIWVNRLIYEHTTRTGADNATYFPTVTTHFPLNFGYAGDWPDLVDKTGSSTPRRDNLAWQGEHTTLGGATTQGLILLSTSLLRDLTGAPNNAGALGCLELNPLDPLFNTTVGGLISAPGAAVGTQDYLFNIQALGGGITNALHRANVNLYAQELRVDLATGNASLGALDTHHFRN